MYRALSSTPAATSTRRARRRPIVAAWAPAAVLLTAWATQPAHAQSVDRRYQVEPTGGVALPGAPLAGEHDARSVSVNPAGLQFLPGSEALLVLAGADSDTATRGDTGGGLFLAGPAGGGWLPRVGLGLGLEVLRPSRSHLLPDPGTPLRLSAAASLAAPWGGAVGVAWHHFVDDLGLDGLDTFDLGVSARLGNHVALGALVRDLNGPRVLGALVQRRYEGELTVRPTGNDVLDLGLGGRIGEQRGNVDGWARGSLRLRRGLYAHLVVETRELSMQTRTGAEVLTSDGRDVRATLGVEVSLGSFGVTAFGSAERDDRGDGRALGGGVMLRTSLVAVPSVLAPSDHLERVELSGSLDGPALVSLVGRLRAIGRDRSARAVALVFDDLSAGWGALREVREDAALRGAGKRIYAFLGSSDTRDYYLASVADKVYLDPAGALALTGIATTTYYWRGALELIGVTPEFEKIAEYKSAPEQFTRTSPSAPAARMRAELLDGIWGEVVESIARSRKLTVAEVQALVDHGLYSAGDLADPAAAGARTGTGAGGDQATALATPPSERKPAWKLVDAVATPERAAFLISEDLGAIYPVRGAPLERPAQWQRPKIAVIHLAGDIIDGASQSVPFLGRKMAGGETVSQAIAAARESDQIGAIVLRIDSPGGSALASGSIAREVFATRGVKPILCSMSNVAASGGYFAAAGCDLIYAEPTTITGSIGIFFGKFELSALMARLGVTAEVALRGKRADLDTMLRPYRPEERELLREQIKYSYGRFVGAVAEGRGLSRAQVDAVGRGHVWTGARAKEVGLVDRLGGIGDALDEAKRRMGLAPEARVELIQGPRREDGLLTQLSKLVTARAQAASPSAAWLPLLRGLLPSVVLEPGVAQARLPFELSLDPP